MLKIPTLCEIVACECSADNENDEHDVDADVPISGFANVDLLCTMFILLMFFIVHVHLDVDLKRTEGC